MIRTLIIHLKTIYCWFDNQQIIRPYKAMEVIVLMPLQSREVKKNILNVSVLCTILGLLEGKMTLKTEKPEYH